MKKFKTSKFFTKKKKSKFSIPSKNSSFPNSKKKKSSLNSSLGTESYDPLPYFQWFNIKLIVHPQYSSEHEICPKLEAFAGYAKVFSMNNSVIN